MEGEVIAWWLMVGFLLDPHSTPAPDGIHILLSSHIQGYLLPFFCFTLPPPTPFASIPSSPCSVNPVHSPVFLCVASLQKKVGSPSDGQFWLIWRYEGDSTLADLMAANNFPFNVRTCGSVHAGRDREGGREGGRGGKRVRGNVFGVVTVAIMCCSAF